MYQTRILSGRRMMAVACCLVILALNSAMARAQDKGAGISTDRPVASRQPAQTLGATAPSSANPDLPCAGQSAVAELGCFPPKALISSPPLDDGVQFLQRGGFDPAGPGEDFWSKERSLYERAKARSAMRTVSHPKVDSSGLRHLSEQADDPMASVASFTLETSYFSSLRGIEGVPGQTRTTYRYSIPFNIQGTPNTLRVSLPNAAVNLGRSDWGNVEVTDLLGFSNKWGRWGVGAAASFGATHGFGIDQFRAGPALAFVTNKGRWQVGALNRNLFSRNAAVSSIQPVIAYQLGSGWSLSAGDLEYKIDWHRSGLATLPVGFQFAKIVPRGSRYFRLCVAPQYNSRIVYSAPRWSVTMGVSILGPSE